MSRIYVGIHFEFSNIAGWECGQTVANYVFANSAQPIAAPGATGLGIVGIACLLRGRRAPRPER